MADRHRPAVRAAFAAALLVTSLSGCVSSAFNSGAYHEDAKAALGSAISETRSASLAADALVHHKVSNAYGDVMISDSEDALGPIQASFGTVDPPIRAQDELRTNVLELLGQAEDTLAEARIAVRRGDLKGVAESRDSLSAIADKLEKLKDGLR
jgi:hypothetical protein